MATRTPFIRRSVARSAGHWLQRRLPPADARARLGRLVAVAATTGIVVGLWTTLSPEDAPPAPPAAVEARITGPAPEVLPGGGPPVGGTPQSTSEPAVQLPGPPQPAEPEGADSFVRFIVQPGDTLFDISVVYGVSVDDILRFNPSLGDGTRIDVGQEVLVPQFDE